MAVLFKKALFDCFGEKEVSLVPNKESSVYDCCTQYWLPIDDRMWSGEIEFRFIENWAEDVEFTEDLGNINNKTTMDKSTTRPAIIKRRTKRACKKENWDTELYPETYYGMWDNELYSDEYMTSFGDSWEGDFFTDLFMKTCLLMKLGLL